MTLRQTPAGDQQLELFTAMFTDISTRDARESMELPFLSLSKSPRSAPIVYKTEDVELIVTGGAPFGIANVWDWDLMMWLMSQIRQAIDEGLPVSRRVRFHRHAFLKAARRTQGGSQYQRLEDSIARLKNTNVVTTLRAERGRTVMFSWIEHAELQRDQAGNVASAVVVIPEWLFEAVSNKSLILSLHHDYFLLTGGVERWLYRFIRKGAGKSSNGWKWTFRTLHKRCGSAREFKYFARDMRFLINKGKLLDYGLNSVELNGEESLHAWTMAASQPEAVQVESVQTTELRLKSITYERAKEEAPGYDIHGLEADWRRACKRDGVLVRDPDAAYLGWCRAVHKKRPLRA